MGRSGFPPSAAVTGDALSAEELRAWRQAQRRALLAARAALPADLHEAGSARIFAQVDALVAALVEARKVRVVGAYLPIRAEPDPLPWLHAFARRGGVVALPVIESGSIGFHRWEPGDPLAAGVLGTRTPQRLGVVAPELLVIPLVGFDRERYRLGYGGGYYDRLLAASPRPFTIGVGFALSRLDSIRPQPHDWPMDTLVTDDGVLP